MANQTKSRYQKGLEPKGGKSMALPLSALRKNDHSILSRNWYLWGFDDMLPALLLEAVGTSKTALSCVKQIETIAYGSGVASVNGNPESEKKPIFDTLWAKTVANQSYFDGAFAWQVWQFPGGEIQCEPVKMHCLRKGKNEYEGMFAYDNRLGLGVGDQGNISDYNVGSIRGLNATWLPAFRHRTYQERLDLYMEQVHHHGAFLGEIYFMYEADLLGQFYPHPAWVAGVHDIKADSSSSSLALEVLENGAMPSSVIAYPGKLSHDTEPAVTNYDGHGNEVIEEIDSPFVRVQKQLESHTGKSNRMKTMIVEQLAEAGIATDKPPVVYFTDQLKQVDALQKLRTMAVPDVCMAFQISPIIIGADSKAMFDSGEKLKVLYQLTERQYTYYRKRYVQAVKDVFATDVEIARFDTSFLNLQDETVA